MAYIGREPQVGNFQVCDAISVVNGQAAYTMQVSSVNVSPETANHMLVSLNGVLQAPGSSYTVSGSTITFASNLVTGDVINFIHILGSVLDLGVPSDSTVSLAKLTATGTKNSTTFLRGDNTFASAGGTFSPRFQAHLTSNQSVSGSTETVISLGDEDFDVGGCFNNTSGTVTLNGISTPAYSFAPNVAGLYIIGAKLFAQTANNYSIMYVYKNTTTIGENQYYNDIGGARPHYLTNIVSMNGSSDYVNMRYWHNNGSALNVYPNLQNTMAFGYLLKAD